MQRRLCCFLIVFFLLSGISFAAEPFSEWLKEFQVKAASEGISTQTLDMAFRDVELLSWVIDADRRQPEFKKTLNEYLAGAVSSGRIERGRRMLKENRMLLHRISRQYRVQPHYLVALWGIETNYGRNTGKVPILSALATLAYDARRSAYFSRELLNVLHMLQSEKVQKQQLVGSWAGAMGQHQFMPSTFLGFAVDGDGDGRIDLWNNKADSLASAANYLHSSGWQWRHRWGREVRLPKQLATGEFKDDSQAPLAAWQRRGVRLKNGADLPKSNLAASLVLPEGQDGPAFLVYENYRVLMKWNRAHSFALAVGMLADRIAAKGR